MIRALIDGNVLDYLADNPDALVAVNAATLTGRLRLLGTQILRAELDAMKGKQHKLPRWRELTAVLDSLDLDPVPLAAFMLDYSALDGPDDLATDEQSDQHERMTRGQRNRAEDAMLAMTASAHDAVLITSDSDLFNHATEQNIPVANPPALAWLARGILADLP